MRKHTAKEQTKKTIMQSNAINTTCFLPTSLKMPLQISAWQWKNMMFGDVWTRLGCITMTHKEYPKNTSTPKKQHKIYKIKILHVLQKKTPHQKGRKRIFMSARLARRWATKDHRTPSLRATKSLRVSWGMK